jgi:hypothetical protein
VRSRQSRRQSSASAIQAHRLSCNRILRATKPMELELLLRRNRLKRHANSLHHALIRSRAEPQPPPASLLP